MHRGFRNLKDCVFHSPSSLVNLSPKMRGIASGYLPFSTGIEIECSAKHMFKMYDIEKEMNKIPNIMSFRVHTIEAELDFRIPSGIKGLVALENVCNLLPEHFKLNPASGIHYHIDFTQYWNHYRAYDRSMEKATNVFLRELDTWNYQGDYNSRCVDDEKGNWVRMCSLYKTIEFRIGEMSFDYEILAKRIIHCNSMVNKYIKALTSHLDLC